MIKPDDLVVETIIESLSVGLMVINPSGDMVVTNQALSDIFGISRTEFMSKGWAELFIIDETSNREFNQILLDAAKIRMTGRRYSVPFVRRDGEKLHLSVNSSFISRNGDTVAVVLLVEDVTSNYLLHAREKEYRSAIAKLQNERVQGLNKLAMSVAHQIRNPLATIGGYGNLLLRNREIGENAIKQLGYILEESGKLERIVRATREYASISSAEKTRVPTALMFEKLKYSIDDVADVLSKKLVLDADISVPNITVDPETFPKALRALLRNAMDFDPAKTVFVEVRAIVEKGEVIISISDQGRGISVEDRPYVFDPFFSTKPDGVGMGLPLAKRIVAEHRGGLNLNDRRCGGIEAVIRVPGNGSDQMA